MTSEIDIRRLGARGTRARVEELSVLLIDCVDGGASVSFMAPLSRERADRFWNCVADAVESGGTVLLVAEMDGELVGTVQLVPAPQENQPHRADVAKMLVRTSARRRGIGRALMQAVEDVARDLGRTLLVLDTVPGMEGERLYAGLGWIPVGRVPGFALMPNGAPCDTMFFYRQL